MNKDRPPSLENQLCFSVYACAREITKLYRPILDQLGVTYPQYLALMVLWEEGATTVSHIGERLYLDSGTLTPLLKRLEEAGLVTRERSQDDERKVVIRLTEEGEQLKEGAAQIPKTLVKKSGINQEEYSKLLGEFQDLLQRVHRLNTQR